MKKIKNFVKNNVKVVIAFIVGGIVLGGTATVIAATVIASSQVAYTPPSGSGVTATNVQDAIDQLYTRANTWIDPSYIDFTTLATNTKKTVLASSAGICIKRNNKVSCMKKGNWSVEKDHIQQIFSDVGAYNSSTGLGCAVSSFYVDCIASDFHCYVSVNGYVGCDDQSDNSGCDVIDAGSVGCR